VIPGAPVPRKDCAQATISLEDIAHFVLPSADRWSIPIKAESVLNTSRVDSRSLHMLGACRAAALPVARENSVPRSFAINFGSVAAAHVLRIGCSCHYRFPTSSLRRTGQARHPWGGGWCAEPPMLDGVCGHSGTPRGTHSISS
jgi:hypothetical protein